MNSDAAQQREETLMANPGTWRHPLAPYLPAARIEVRSGPVRLMLPTEADLAGLAEALAAGGLDDDVTRSSLVWQPDSREDAATSTITRMLGHFASAGPTWHLPLIILAGDTPIGRQDVHCDRGPFSVMREVATGSYLINTQRRRGYGVAARAGVLALSFALGAERACTGWLAGNEASAAVSAKLGYQVTHEQWIFQRGQRVLGARATVTADDFARAWKQPVEVTGVDDDVRAALDCPSPPCS